MTLPITGAATQGAAVEVIPAAVSLIPIVTHAMLADQDSPVNDSGRCGKEEGAMYLVKSPGVDGNDGGGDDFYVTVVASGPVNTDPWLVLGPNARTVYVTPA